MSNHSSDTKKKGQLNKKTNTETQISWQFSCYLSDRWMNIHAKSQRKYKMFFLGDSQLGQHTKKVAV